MPISAPAGTAMTNAVRTSAPGTRMSLRTFDRPRMLNNIAMVSLADGSSRGLTAPVRDSSSHAAKIAATMANRASLMGSVAVMSASGFGRHRRELGRDDLARRHQVLHAAELGHVQRRLKCGRNVGARHAAVGIELQNRVLVFGGCDIVRHFIEFGDQLDSF